MTGCALATFSTTHDAFAAQRALEGAVPFTVMPVLRSISASCGIALRLPLRETARANLRMSAAGLAGGFSLYLVSGEGPDPAVSPMDSAPLGLTELPPGAHPDAMALLHDAGWREARGEGVSGGLLLTCGENPVAAVRFGPVCTPGESAYAGWGEITALFTRPDARGRGFAALLLEEALARLAAAGHPGVIARNPRESAGVLAFFAARGFTWDGLLLPGGAEGPCLRYSLI